MSRPKDSPTDFPRRMAFLMLFNAMAVYSACCAGDRTAGYTVDTHRSRELPNCTYAIYREDAGTDASTILYYFHGSGGDERTWPKANGEIIDAWKKRGIAAPVVVAITFGSDWYMLPEDVSPTSISIESFLQRLIPEIEGKLGSAPKRRVLFGFSRGGANAAQLLFRFPGSFDKAVIASPALYPFSPYASEAEVDSFIQSEEKKHRGIVDIIKKAFGRDTIRKEVKDELSSLRAKIPDPNSWPRANVLENMRQAPSGKKIPVYISDGVQDVNGFFPGAETLAKKAGDLGYEVTFEALQGGHLALRSEEIARFLAGN